jgi:hypothetical protein
MPPKGYTINEVVHVIYLTYMEIALDKMLKDHAIGSKRWYLTKNIQKQLGKLDMAYPAETLPVPFTAKAEEFYKLVDQGLRDLIESIPEE